MKTKRIDPRRSRDLLELTLLNFRPPFRPSVPTNGWIRALRLALRLTQRDLAKRMNCNHTAIQAWEQRESLETIQLCTLKNAAHAMDCELVYFFAPRSEHKNFTDIFRKIHGSRRPLIIAPRDLFRSVDG
jgi:transcriptional regulator with XRE-family HTH domain